MFTVFGVAYSFGEFFGPMADEFDTDRSETAFFFAITTFAYFMIGIVSGRVAELQLRVLWEEMLERFETIEVLGEPERVFSSFVHGYSKMPVKVTRR